MKYVILAVLALAACKPEMPAGVVPGPSDITPPAQITMVPNGETEVVTDFSKMDWTLALIDGKPVAYSATLNLGTKARISGQGPCNRYMADLKSDGKTFEPGLIAGTLMACENLADEGEFFTLLAGIKTMDRSTGQLILRGNGHEMTFLQPIN